MDKMTDILLSTYNGEKFLKQQLDSILAQTEKNWRLIIRDDGSDDSTLKIIEPYMLEYPDKIVLFDDSAPAPLGPCQSFHRLLRISSAPYVMFCDQDDVWLPSKIEIMLTAIIKAESESTQSSPILLHSDLEVVDKNLKLINSSFFNQNRLDPLKSGIRQLTMRNIVTGCAAICNRALIDKSLPIPQEALMHDWWLAMTATLLGELRHVPNALVKYRQHSHNAIGSASWSGQAKKLTLIAAYKRKMNDISKQTEALLKFHCGELSSHDDKALLSTIASLHTLTWWEKRKAILRLRHDNQSFINTLIMLALS